MQSGNSVTATGFTVVGELKRVEYRGRAALQRRVTRPNECVALAPEGCLLQDRDLPGVIKLVLRHSVQHEVEIVSLAGNALA